MRGELRSWRCRELWYRSQTQLRFGIVVAVGRPAGAAPFQPLAWELPPVVGAALKRQKKKKKKKKERKEMATCDIPWWPSRLRIIAVAQVQSLAREILHVAGMPPDPRKDTMVPQTF